jgi:hypothetical protein
MGAEMAKKLPARRPRMQYIVIVQKSELEQVAYGPYPSFKGAEGNAKAWNGYVLPLNTPEQFCPWGASEA